MLSALDAAQFMIALIRPDALPLSPCMKESSDGDTDCNSKLSEPASGVSLKLAY